MNLFRKRENFAEAFKASLEKIDTLPVRKNEHYDLDYWHGILPHEDTNMLLKNDGDFLIRIFFDGNDNRTMCISIRKGEQVHNGLIFATSTKFTLNEFTFKSVRELVNHFQVRKSPIQIGTHSLVLGNPVRRKKWELRQKMLTMGKQLGSGSYGTVYKGVLQRDDEQPVTVAIKVLTQMNIEASTALWREARTMQQYDHPHVVKMYGMSNDCEPFYLVIEFLENGSVEDYLKKKNEKISNRRRLRILHEASLGLDYLHMRGCIHRDIATRNLLIGKVVKVADFGLTRKSKKYKIDTEKPMNLRWLAPDVYETSIVDTTTDVYAFGITIWEVFTVPLETPYSDWDGPTVYDKVIKGGFRLPPTKLMNKDTGELYKDCIADKDRRPTMKMIINRIESLIEAEKGDKDEKESTVSTKHPRRMQSKSAKSSKKTKKKST